MGDVGNFVNLILKERVSVLYNGGRCLFHKFTLVALLYHTESSPSEPIVEHLFACFQNVSLHSLARGTMGHKNPGEHPQENKYLFPVAGHWAYSLKVPFFDIFDRQYPSIFSFVFEPFRYSHYLCPKDLLAIRFINPTGIHDQPGIFFDYLPVKPVMVCGNQHQISFRQA